MKLDDIEYTFRQANFIEAKKQAFKLVGLAKGCFEQDNGETRFDIGQLLSNLGSQDMESVEKFVITYTEAKDIEGNPILLNKVDVFNTHFNKYRDHYLQVIFEGVKFHFLDFIPSGIASNLNIDSLKVLTA